ncbi:acyl-CoA thioesterase [bacterium]|nr:acyl-CoA thioesterase [bacterium]
MPYEFRTQRRVEFADTDEAGIVHFARFFVFMETAEHEFLNSLGTSVSAEWDGNKIGWPRVSVSCEYLSPAKFEDVLDIHLTVLRRGSKSVTYNYLIKNQDTVVAKGQMTAACCICNPGQPIRAIPIPEFLAEQIQEAPV